jgi:hypothetical protein
MVNTFEEDPEHLANTTTVLPEVLANIGQLVVAIEVLPDPETKLKFDCTKACACALREGIIIVAARTATTGRDLTIFMACSAQGLSRGIVPVRIDASSSQARCHIG